MKEYVRLDYILLMKDGKIGYKCTRCQRIDWDVDVIGLVDYHCPYCGPRQETIN